MKGEVKQYVARVNIIEWIVKKLRSLTGIVEDGDIATHSISAEQYVVWKGNPCKASSTINIGDTLSSSNLTLLTNGIGNDIVGATNSKISNLHPTAELTSISEILTLVNKPENNGYALFRVTNTLNNSLTGADKHATVLAFKTSSVSDYIEFISLDYDGDVRTGSYKISTGAISTICQASIHIDSVTGTTSSSGNVSKTFSKHVVILSAWSSSGGCVITSYPGAGADGSGQYTWWFHVCSDTADNHVIANTSLTVYYTYMLVN